MDHCLISHSLTSAWTTLLHCHGKNLEVISRQFQYKLAAAFYLDLSLVCVSTPPRVYRQIASLMGLQLVSSFINVAKMLGAQRETTQRQLNAEKKKKVEGSRVESLSIRLSTTHDKITIIEEMMRKIFTGYEY